MAAYKSGAQSPELAKRFGLATSTVIKLLRDSGVQTRCRPIEGEELALFVKLYQDGARQVDIAKQVGRSKSAIWQALKRTGLI